MAVKHGPCLLTLRKGSRPKDQVPEKTSPHHPLRAHDQRVGTEQDQLSCEPTGTSSGDCQQTMTHVVRASHTPHQPLQNHPSGHLEGWATPWSAEEMLNGQRQRVDDTAHSTTAHDSLPKKRLEEDFC